MNFRAKQFKWFVIALSLLVFLLTLNAKLSLYDQPTHVNTVNSSKLWLNGQKLEPPPATLMVGLLTFVCVVLRLRFPSAPWQRVPIQESIPSRLTAFRAYCFLRPPPSL